MCVGVCVIIRVSAKRKGTEMMNLNNTVTVEMTVEQLMEIANICSFANRTVYNGEIAEYAEFMASLVQKHVFDIEDQETDLHPLRECM